MKLFATTSKGLESVLKDELTALGAENTVLASRGVSFTGDLKMVYLANLWLRTAHRVLIEVKTFPANDRTELYDGIRTINWNEHMSPSKTLSVDSVSNQSKLNHIRFISQVVKDAVVDKFRDETGARPSVDTQNPDIKLNARILKDTCTLSIDSSGIKLHKRGYRSGFAFAAPLMETLAAGIVHLSGYKPDEPLLDPMCGSGTLVIEAALKAKNIAPGSLGRKFGFMTHPSFNRGLWGRLLRDADDKIIPGDNIKISASDISRNSLKMTAKAADFCGVDDIVRIKIADISTIDGRNEGMIITNPPYGERMGEEKELAALYQTLGNMLKRKCTGITAHIFSGSKFLRGKIGLKTCKRDILFNGPIECRLMHYKLY